MTDTTTPIGAIAEIKGSATITHADGTTEPATLGTPVYQGDVVETAADGALNITFVDDTSFALSEGAKFSIDDYSFDPATESGSSDFSVLHGVFVFTSGLIGRDDPDDVKIDTPVGSIGIRGTIIAGKINADGESEITVVEGAIVVKNGVSEITLAQQFESVKLGDFNTDMQPLGVLDAKDVGARYNVISNVTPSLFSNVEDAAQEEKVLDATDEPADQESVDQPAETAPDTSDAPVEDSGEIEAETMEDTSANEQPAQEVLTLETTQTGFETTPLTSTTTTTEAARATDTSATTSTSALAAMISGATITTDPRSGTYTNNVPNLRTNTTTTTAGIVDIRNPGISDIHIIGDRTNTANYNKIGMEMYAVGDVNNDGFEDFVFTSDWAVGQDHSYVVYGQANRFGTGELIDKVDHNITSLNDTDANGGEIGVLPDITVPRLQDQIDFNGDGKFDSITSYPGSNGGHGQVTINTANHVITINNPMTNTVLGGDFGEINDFNGDGRSDIMMSLVGTGTSTIPDTAIVLLGKEVTASTTLSTTSLPTNAFKITVGPQMSIMDGGGVGDFNGDGFDDIGLIVKDAEGKGHAFVVYGNATPGDMTFANLLDTTKAFHVQLGALASGHEVNLGAIGDYNGDGFDDFAIGMPNADNNHGLVALVNGRATDTDTRVGSNISAYASNQSLVGTAGNDTLSSGAITNTGITMSGGAGNDAFHIGTGNFVNIDGGTGDDTIRFLGDNRNIDFSGFNFEQISGIENISFMDSDQTVMLTVENIFNMLRTSDTGDLWLNLDGSDGTLQIDAKSPIVSTGLIGKITDALQSETGLSVTHSNSNGYNAFQIGDHTLYIDASLTTQVV